MNLQLSSFYIKVPSQNREFEFKKISTFYSRPSKMGKMVLDLDKGKAKIFGVSLHLKKNIL